MITFQIAWMSLSTGHAHTCTNISTSNTFDRRTGFTFQEHADNAGDNCNGGNKVDKDKPDCGFVDITQDLVEEHSFPHDNQVICSRQDTQSFLWTGGKFIWDTSEALLAACLLNMAAWRIDCLLSFPIHYAWSVWHGSAPPGRFFSLHLSVQIL